MRFTNRRASSGDPPAVHLRSLIRLALGEPVGDDRLDWRALRARADRERVLALAWRRSGPGIRAHAPDDVAARWRAGALAIELQGERVLRALSAAIGELQSRGLSPVVLKGPPLSQRLYGDPTVRPLADCDVFVPPHERAAATDALLAAGWSSQLGEPPAEETFALRRGGERLLLELHSTLLDDPLLSHLRVPVEHAPRAVGGVTLPVHWGPCLPAFLAAHLAKHETTPLLWLLDSFTLWRALDRTERDCALAAARRVGLARHLRWAERLTTLVPRAASGDGEALRAIASLSRSTGGLRRLARLVRLSQHPGHAAAVVAGRVWPAEWRDDWRCAPRYFLTRAAGWVSRHLDGARAPAADPPGTRTLPVDAAELDALLAESLGRGLALWIRPRGTSMQPAIPPSAAVRIVPASAREIRPLDVVLARLPHGQLVLHRVLHAGPDRMHLKGDAMRRRDAVVPPHAILGVCDLVDVDGRVWRIEERPRDALAQLAAAARERWLPPHARRA